MIQLIEGLPDAVVGIEAVGQVESAEYDTIAAPAVKHALERHPKIRLIHVLDERFTGYTAGGALRAKASTRLDRRSDARRLARARAAANH